MSWLGSAAYPANKGDSTRRERSCAVLSLAWSITLVVSVVVAGGGCAGLALTKHPSDGAQKVWSFVLALGVTGVCVGLFLGLLSMIIEDWSLRNGSTLLRAFRNRDRRGQRTPPRRVSTTLDMRAESDIYKEQPDEVLLALVARGHRAVPSRWGALLNPVTIKGIVPGNAACTVLTAIDFANEGTDVAGAIGVIPLDVWPRAVRALLRSNQAAVRKIGVQCALASRKQLMRACLRDEDAEVSGLAWDRINESLTPREFDILLSSRHEVIRQGVVGRGPLSRRQLGRLCLTDTSAAVRRGAFSLLREELTVPEARRLAGGGYGDIRRLAIETGRVPRAQMICICTNDRESQVCDSAWRQLSNRLSADECVELRLSKHVDVRQALAEHGVTPRWLLVELVRDLDDFVRHTALDRVISSATPEEINRFARNRDDKVRLAAAMRCADRNTLHRLVKDQNMAIVRAAFSRLSPNLDALDCARLRRSRDRDIRLSVAKSPAASKKTLRKLCRDSVREICTEACLQVLDGAPKEEFAERTKSKSIGIRLAVARHPQTPRDILFELTSDIGYEVARTAFDRISSRLTASEFRALADSKHEEIRLALVSLPNTPRSVLEELSKDGSTRVSEAALRRIAELRNRGGR